MAVALTALIVWGFSGVVVAWLLSRHGHNFWLLGILGLGYGPFLTLIWLRGIQGQPTKTRIVDEAGIEPDGGWIDVLVGLDGRSDSVESTRQVLTTLGPALRRVGLVSVLDHEVGNAPDAFTVDERRIEHLRQAAGDLGVPHAQISLITGQPDKALREHAQAFDFDLLVVAHRRADLVSSIRGSTTGRLARAAELPVLIGPPARSFESTTKEL